MAFIRFEALITEYLKFGPENSLVFARLAVMVTGMCVNHWIGLMDGIGTVYLIFFFMIYKSRTRFITTYHERVL